MYLGMTGMGMAAVLCAGKLLGEEMKRRREAYRRQLHTRFLVLDSALSVDLSRTHYVIGRRKRRCDISLDALGDRTIGKVHGVLWHDGRAFCIAPHYGKTGREKKKEYSRILINGIPVPPKGSVIRCGDVIRMGRHRFMLQDTGKEM
jgi:hypothetical protein